MSASFSLIVRIASLSVALRASCTSPLLASTSRALEKPRDESREAKCAASPDAVKPSEPPGGSTALAALLVPARALAVVDLVDMIALPPRGAVGSHSVLSSATATDSVERVSSLSFPNACENIRLASSFSRSTCALAAAPLALPPGATRADPDDTTGLGDHVLAPADQSDFFGALDAAADADAISCCMDCRRRRETSELKGRQKARRCLAGGASPRVAPPQSHAEDVFIHCRCICVSGLTVAMVVTPQTTDHGHAHRLCTASTAACKEGFTCG